MLLNKSETRRHWCFWIIFHFTIFFGFNHSWVTEVAYGSLFLSSYIYVCVMFIYINIHVLSRLLFISDSVAGSSISRYQESDRISYEYGDICIQNYNHISIYALYDVWFFSRFANLYSGLPPPPRPPSLSPLFSRSFSTIRLAHQHKCFPSGIVKIIFFAHNLLINKTSNKPHWQT